VGSRRLHGGGWANESGRTTALRDGGCSRTLQPMASVSWGTKVRRKSMDSPYPSSKHGCNSTGRASSQGRAPQPCRAIVMAVDVEMRVRQWHCEQPQTVTKKPAARPIWPRFGKMPALQFLLHGRRVEGCVSCGSRLGARSGCCSIATVTLAKGALGDAINPPKLRHFSNFSDSWPCAVFDLGYVVLSDFHDGGMSGRQSSRAFPATVCQPFCAILAPSRRMGINGLSTVWA